MHYETECMHGDVEQSQRERILKNFINLQTQVLIATDVASRGIDVPDIELVV